MKCQNRTGVSFPVANEGLRLAPQCLSVLVWSEALGAFCPFLIKMHCLEGGRGGKSLSIKENIKKKSFQTAEASFWQMYACR